APRGGPGGSREGVRGVAGGAAGPGAGPEGGAGGDAMRGARWLLLLAAAACASAPVTPPSAPDALRVAVPMDDLPRHGPEAPGQDRLALHHAVLEALSRHAVPRVYGFVNAGRVQPGDRAALEAWVAAGYPLGNHTAHHPDIGKVGIQPYLADVDAG